MAEQQLGIITFHGGSIIIILYYDDSTLRLTRVASENNNGEPCSVTVTALDRTFTADIPVGSTTRDIPDIVRNRIMITFDTEGNVEDRLTFGAWVGS